MKEIKYKKEYAKTLIDIAAQDLESAELLHKSNPKRKENIFFLAQQAIEKALKALLCNEEKAIPMTHDLNFIIDRISNSEEIPLADSIVELTEFATIRRYEGSVIEYSKEDLESSLTATKQVIEWANKLINL